MKIVRAFVLFLLVVALLPVSALGDQSVTLNPKIKYGGTNVTVSWECGDEIPEGGYGVVVGAVRPDGTEGVLRIAGTTAENSLKTPYMVLGYTYIVFVCDLKGTVLGQQIYTLTEPHYETYRSYLSSENVIATVETLKEDPEDNFTQVSFKADEICKDLAEGKHSYNTRYSFEVPISKFQMKIDVKIAYESPDGSVYVTYAENVNYPYRKNYSKTITCHRSSYDFFDALYKQKGTIPSGEYKIKLFFGEYLITTSTFTIE